MNSKAGAVMHALHRSVVMKRELSQKTKLAVFCSIFVPILTYGHELWVMTERMRSRVQAKMFCFNLLHVEKINCKFLSCTLSQA